MSNPSLIYCCPVPGLEKYWDFIGSDGQLFFDQDINLFTFRKGYEFNAVSLKDNMPVPDMRFHLEINETILTLSYSRNKKYVAIQTSTFPTKVYSIETRHEIDIRFKQRDKNASFITFDWLRTQHSAAEFFVLDSSCIFLFKVDEKKLKLKQLAHFAMDSNYAWFEPKSETLIAINSAGQVQTVFFSLYAKSKKVKGPRFDLDVRSKSLTKNQIEDLNKPITADSYLKYNVQNLVLSPSLRNRDILKNSTNPNGPKSQHKILFINMYGAPTVLHLNVEYGIIFLFSLSAKRIDICQSTLTVPPRGTYTLTLVDNLVVVHSINEGKSYVFDVKKSNPSKPIGPTRGMPRHNVKASPRMNDISMTTSTTLEFKQLDIRRSRSAPHDTPEDARNGTHGTYSGKKEHLDNEELVTLEIEVEEDAEEAKFAEAEERGRQKTSKTGLSIGSPFKDKSGSPFKDPALASLALIDTYLIEPVKVDESGIMPTSATDLDFSTLMPMEPDRKQEPNDECLYTDEARIMDYNYFIDIKNNLLLTYDFNLKMVPFLFRDNINAFFFLVRRTGCKDLAIDFLKKLISKNEEVMNLSFIFHKLLEIYRKVQEKRSLKEGKALPPSRKKNEVEDSPKNFLMEESMLSSKLTSSDNQSGLNAFTPYNVIIQTDIYIQIFLHFAEEPDFNQEYLIQILLEYFRASMENSIQVLDGIQALLFKLIITTKKFSILYQMLQFHCLDDSLELAEVLIKLGMKDKSKFEGSHSNPLIKCIDGDYLPEAFQLGLDMLERLQKTKKIVKFLLMVDNINEAMEVAARKGFDGIDPRWFLDAATKQSNPKIVKDVTQYFLKSVKKAKGVEANTIAWNMVEIVQTFQRESSKSPDKI